MRSARRSAVPSFTLAMALALLAGACGGGGDGATTTSAGTLPGSTAASTTAVGTTNAPAQEVTSDDGALTVSVPAGQIAEPVTVAASDVDTSFLDPAVEVLGAYDLGPDGAVFSEPVTVTFRTGIPETPGEVPVLTVVYGAPDAWAAPGETTVEAVGGFLVTTFVMDHFTTVVELRPHAMLQLDPPSFEGDVGARFSAGVNLVLVPRRGDLEDLQVNREHLSRFSSGVIEAGGGSGFYSAGFVCASHGEGTYGFNLVIPHQWLNRWLDSTAKLLEGLAYFYGIGGVAMEADAQWRFRDSLEGPALCTVTATPWTVARDRQRRLEDWAGDLADSISAHAVTFAQGWLDLVGFGAGTIDVSAEQAEEWLNGSLYECGAVSADGPLVVCPEGVRDMPAGPMLVAVAQVAEPIPPADPMHSYVYSVVFESNGDPADDWVFFPPYDWDYFQGADRWYQLIWDHRAQQWSVMVNQVGADQQVGQAPSAVRVLMEGNLIAWLIPMDEFPSPDPAIRFTTFGHDGMWSEDDRGGDVSGADPTEPLLPISSFTG